MNSIDTLLIMSNMRFLRLLCLSNMGVRRYIYHLLSFIILYHEFEVFYYIMFQQFVASSAQKLCNLIAQLESTSKL